MYTWGKGTGSGGGGGTTSIIALLNIGENNIVPLPAGYTIVNMVVEKIDGNAPSTLISMGSVGPDYDSIVPQQAATTSTDIDSVNTILIDYTPAPSEVDPIYIYSSNWLSYYNFYITINKFK